MRIWNETVCSWLGAVLIAGTASLAMSCDDEDDYDYDPPAGQGTLVVDNFTGDRVYVYIDGQEVASVTSGKHRYYDLDPGVHRVVLDGDDIARSWAGDVDVLEDRLTVMDVGGDYNSFTVQVYFD